MEAPKHLSHKPIISVNDYDKIDGKYIDDTDVVALSVGLAQYDIDDISAKVWRYKQESDRWSRQSEELPLHRVIDLCILTIASFITDGESDFPITNLKETVTEKENLILIKEYFKENKKKLIPRINELQRIIETFNKNLFKPNYK